MLRDRANSVIYPKDPRFSTSKYLIGDLSSMVGAVNGRFEDWVYGAGWDQTAGGASSKCNPVTYDLSEDSISYSN